MRADAPPYAVRLYDDADEGALLALLNASLGGGPTGARTAEFVRWKHFANPFGRSFMLLAEADGGIVGLRAFLRWTFTSGDRVVRAVRAVDTATHPAYQGRGIFSRLTTEAIELLADEAEFIFNTPNEKSLPGYLKMGWEVVARVPLFIGLARPIPLARHLMGAEARIEQPGEASAVRDVLRDAALPGSGSPDRRLSTPRTREYLLWRYADAPGLSYRASATDDGVAIYRTRRRGRAVEATIAEVLARPGRGAAVLRRVRRDAGADYMTAHFPQGSAARRALYFAGFVPAPRRMTFVARALRRGLDPDPRRFESWALTLGDLEVF